jgi:hypothetical protein
MSETTGTSISVGRLKNKVPLHHISLTKNAKQEYKFWKKITSNQSFVGCQV